MRQFLLAFLLFVCPSGWGQTPVEIRQGRLDFGLGTVQVPAGTQWKKFAEPGKALYIGSRQREVFMVTINKRTGAIPSGQIAESMQAYAESYAAEIAGSFKAQAQSVRSRPTARGCEFSFVLSNGVQVLGDYRQGKGVIVLFTAMNGSQKDFQAMARSFQASPGKFAPPVYE